VRKNRAGNERDRQQPGSLHLYLRFGYLAAISTTATV
jgi:hypothetical protein